MAEMAVLKSSDIFFGLSKNVSHDGMHHGADERFAVTVISRSKTIFPETESQTTALLGQQTFPARRKLGAVAAFVYFGTVIPKTGNSNWTGNLKQVYQQLSVYRYNAVDDGRFGQEIVGIKSIHRYFEIRDRFDHADSNMEHWEDIS